MTDQRFEAAIAAIDAANADDPNVLVVDGVERPKEQAHAELMTTWVRRLDPGATDEQLLAARAHHLRRWAVPRRDYPEGRAGYLRWRTALSKRHAADVGTILAAHGYGEPAIARVQQLIRKQGLAVDPAVQVHEDALCIVFLETQLDSTIDRLGRDKVVDVVAKTVKKMSPTGIEAAAELELSDLGRGVLADAVAVASAD
ncbi:MAG: DUF4202 domain-containing protein [Actinomycetota bacterium]